MKMQSWPRSFFFFTVRDAVAEFPRVASLPLGRKHMPRTKTVTARLTDAKALRGLRPRYSPSPEVLTVGVPHYQPFQMIVEDGNLGRLGLSVFR